jgi:hypothetical protein
LLACGLSFRQIACVIKENRDRLGTAANMGCVSAGEASNMCRVVCAATFQLISDPMNTAWAFSVAADVSTDNFGSSHLDTRINFPPVFTDASELMSLHLLSIPLFEESHSGESLFDIFARFLDAMCPNWREKLIGSSTDGAPNMTGCVQGFTTRLKNEVSCSDSFYRIWCLAHQLDIVVKNGVTGIADMGAFPFLATLTTIIGWLRQEIILIRRLKSKCPYLINVRWTSLRKALKWLLANRQAVCDYFAEKRYALAPSKAW